MNEDAILKTVSDLRSFVDSIPDNAILKYGSTYRLNNGLLHCEFDFFEDQDIPSVFNPKDRGRNHIFEGILLILFSLFFAGVIIVIVHTFGYSNKFDLVLIMSVISIAALVVGFFLIMIGNKLLCKHEELLREYLNKTNQ